MSGSPSRASHSPLFKDLKLKKVPPAPTDSSKPFDGEAPRPMDFTETEHYQIARAFLANPELMLRELMDREADGGSGLS
jgi:predicted ATPase